MSTYILIHGSWHGAWCWEKVIPLLEKVGHTIVAPDLPGHGQDNTPTKEITLQSYIDCITRIVDKSVSPVILVGHSLGGVMISQVAEYYPDKIQALVYVAGFLPKNGESMFTCAKVQAPTRFSKLMKMDIAENTFSFPIHAIKDFAYNLCSKELVENLKPRFCIEPLMPSNTPVTLSDDKFGRVPKVYIECLQDKAILIETQRKMHTQKPCTVYTLDSDHSPFYSDPERLVQVLLQVT
ncbi:MAG: alpha/beta fold hydrolase [Gammaproteobacteria bacterium]|jgi:pimeloyl-ACP methyl ester carboxylesterase|nr:alpha/beta fold hydrolase [Gammaproteobacteria bacterium]